MIKNLIKVDYILSSWFSNTHNKLIPGTAFLFLYYVVFLWVSIFFFSTSFSQKEINIEIYVSVRLIGAAIILYGFQNRTKRYIEKLKMNEVYSKLS